MESAAHCTVDCNYAVARHPIYRVDGDVFGYELLYRTMGGPNAAILPSDEEATLAVLANGIEAISRDIDPKKKIFINFSREILEKGYHAFLDPERFVIEVLEHVTCDAAFTALVCKIREAGFVLALDDYVGDTAFDPILPFVTYVKVDFLALRDDPARLEAVLHTCRSAGRTVLAEKVETEADIALCRARGIPLAQGYFYSRPQVVQARALPANQATKLALLAEVSRPDIDEKKVRDILGADVSLAYKLLRHVNAATFYRGQAVESLDFAIRLLGRDALASWVAVNLLASLGATPRDRELAFASAVRSRFLALIDRAWGGKCHQGEGICLLGLLSLLDAMLGVPMASALSGLTIDTGIRQALLGFPSQPQICLALCRGFDGSPDAGAATVLERFGISPETASRVYFEALAWAAHMFHG
ncbi:EAL and HDOD domain-containing protein [Solidesulfovibrio sp.]|uniref:EAL and HDOD domain-containing protein n=1 Tax=Solidesulfovibrio sp. TaxID=2910990 RepID=UPI002B1F48F9|nr:EAL domain-containing protein [Solidesulfovibrio sp.]MEA5087855.1 EAL domain-containing protein [Solidesulfovibrio sp.]